MTLSYLREFLSEFLALDKPTQRQIRNKLDELARTDATSFLHQPLKGEQFKGLYKLRVGDYRLIYQLYDNGLRFITLGHRRDIYR